MRLPRVRFTVRRMMVAVAVVAVIVAVLVRVVRYYSEPSTEHYFIIWGD